MERRIKWKKAGGLNGLPREPFTAACALTSYLLLPRIRKCWESEDFFQRVREEANRNDSRKGTSFMCRNLRCIFIGKVIAKVILEHIMKYHGSLNGSLSSCINYVNIRQSIPECSAVFKSPLHLLFIDFIKAFDIANMECISRALLRMGIHKKSLVFIRVAE